MANINLEQTKISLYCRNGKYFYFLAILQRLSNTINTALVKDVFAVNRKAT